MDRTDRKIVALLQENARRSNKELAALCGIAPSTCSERVRRLEATGVLVGYRAIVNPDALGIGLRAFLAIRLTRQDEGAVERFRQKVMATPEVVGLAHVTGANDFLVSVVVVDSAHLRDLAVSGFSTIPQVAHIQTSLVFEQVNKAVLPDFLDRVGQRQPA